MIALAYVKLSHISGIVRVLFIWRTIMTNLFALALIATVSNAVNTAMYVECYTQQHTVDHALDGVFPTYVPRTIKVRVCATTGLSLEEKVLFKALRLGARRGATKAPAPRVPMNDAAKRASITLACANAAASNAARAAADALSTASNGNTLSAATIAARAAQGAAQKAANEARKANAPTKVARPCVAVARSTPTKVKGTKRVRVHHMMHTTQSVMAQVAKKQAIIKAKEDAAIAKAKKWALRKEAYANRKAAMEVIASDAWMNAGVWLSEDLIRGANDWSYQVRIAAFKEARNIAYANAPVATVKVAA